MLGIFSIELVIFYGRYQNVNVKIIIISYNTGIFKGSLTFIIQAYYTFLNSVNFPIASVVISVPYYFMNFDNFFIDFRS